MAKEEVKEAVVEETEVATAEAEVAEATEEITEETVATDETANADEDELSPWYYFFSTGCGWCKKATPVVEGLIEDGYDILMLDLAEPDNQQLNKELQTEYKTQCGTPWFINADTGKQICGFREKDVLELWLKGEDIPEPPRLTGQMPKVPFHGSTNKENIAWKKEYKKWLKENNHMGEDWVSKQRTGDDIINGPRPKSDAPRPPFGQGTTPEDVDKWGEAITKWQEENNHLPNLPKVEMMVSNVKNRLTGQKAPGGMSAGTGLNPDQGARLQRVEQKLDKLMNHLGIK